MKNYKIKNKNNVKVKLDNKVLLKTDNEDLIDISSNYEHINPNDSNYFYIPIFGTSDIHGHFYPEIIEKGNVSYTKGGLDYLAKYINIIRDEFQNRFLYLDAGDLFQGGTESTITNGEIILDYFNLMKVDGCAIGNHEFDYNRTFIEQKVKDAKFPFLTTNLYDKERETKQTFGENHFGSKIYTFTVPNDNKNENGEVQIKIGVIGLAMIMRDNQVYGKGFEKIIFRNYKDELEAEAKELRKNGVKAVILLSHIEIDCGTNLKLKMYKPTDKQEPCNHSKELYKLINSLDEGIIDAIVTGHSHREVHHWIKNIPIISPINNGMYANIIYLAFDRKNNYKLVKDKIRIEGPLPICEKVFKNNHTCEYTSEIDKYLPLVEYKFHNVKIEKDPILKSIHEKYNDKYSKYNETICTIKGVNEVLTVMKNGSFYVGNLMADIHKYITGAEIAILSYGNLRSFWYPGKLRKFNIKDMFPFGNHFCSFVMNGEEIRRMIKIIQNGRKKLYLISGLKQIFIKIEGANYLSELKLYDGFKEYELIPDKDYLVGANNFLIKDGGDDFNRILSWYKPRNLKCDYGLDSDVVENYLREIKIIDMSKYMDNDNPRIKFIN